MTEEQVAALEKAKAQMADFYFPGNQEQLDKYFNKGGIADVAIGVVGKAFATKDKPALKDYNAVIDTSFLK